MKVLTGKEIAKAVGGVLDPAWFDEKVFTITTDSRTATKNGLFIPIIGEKHNGHQFIESALRNGCTMVLSSEEIELNQVGVIRVADTRLALGALASYYIDKINPFRIAITGSVGKTTTKDLIFAVAQQAGKALKTPENKNNDIGLPLTVLGLEDENIAVLEMGMNHFGEIEYLSSLVRPDIGVITNIGVSHIEYLGSQEGILQAKMELAKSLKEEGTLILNGDDPLLYSMKGKLPQKILYYGLENPDCDLMGEIKDLLEDESHFTVDGEDYALFVPGRHNVLNALSAICVGRILGLSKDQIQTGLGEFKPIGLRQNRQQANGYTVLVDCYNAAPESILASLSVLKNSAGKRKFAVLGSVGELGKMRDHILYDLGKKIAKLDPDFLITVTEDAKAINEGAKQAGYDKEVNLKNNQEAIHYLKNHLEPEDVVLVKGSRKYGMEEICHELLREEERA